MGIFSNNEKFHRCEFDEQGVEHCIIGEKNKEGNFARSELKFSLDENCNPTFVGPMTILEGDETKVKKIIEDAVTSCRKGIR